MIVIMFEMLKCVLCVLNITTNEEKNKDLLL